MPSITMVFATQTWIRVLPVAIYFLLNNPPTAYAQNECDSDDNIAIEFPEGHSVISPTDSRYVQHIFQGIPDTVEISPDKEDPNPVIKFDDRFRVLQGGNIFGQSGTFIQMFVGIDRDGQLSGVEDDLNVLQYSVRCVPTPGSASIYKILKIQIIDVNDNPPEFSNPALDVEVNELAPVGTVVYTISATDKDSGINKEVSYALSKSPDAQFDGSHYFTIQPQAGKITVSKDLDFEPMYWETNNTKEDVFYKIIVTATDGGTPALTSTMTMSITIKDNDDQGPAFEYPSCIPSGTLLGKPCILAKYTSNVKSDVLNVNCKTTNGLVFFPQPEDPDNPNVPVDMIMYDMDTLLDNPITCSISDTHPNGYKTYFQAEAHQVVGSKRYRCIIFQTQIISRSHISELQLIVEAVETSVNQRREHATVDVTVIPTVTSIDEEDNSDDDSSGISTPAVIGIAIGCFVLGVVLTALCALMWCQVQKRRREQKKDADKEVTRQPSNGRHQHPSDQQETRLDDYDVLNANDVDRWRLEDGAARGYLNPVSKNSGNVQKKKSPTLTGSHESNDVTPDQTYDNENDIYEEPDQFVNGSEEVRRSMSFDDEGYLSPASSGTIQDNNQI